MPPKSNSATVFAGATFCVSGAFPGVGSQKQMEMMCSMQTAPSDKAGEIICKRQHSPC
jgi:hypothetical protein